MLDSYARELCWFDLTQRVCWISSKAVFSRARDPLADHRAQEAGRPADDFGKPHLRSCSGPTAPGADCRLHRQGSFSSEGIAGLSAAMRGLTAARTAVMTAVAAIDADTRRMARASAASHPLLEMSRCASRKHSVDGGEQIRRDGSFEDKSIRSRFNRRELRILFRVDAESDQLKLREMAPDSAN